MNFKNINTNNADVINEANENTFKLLTGIKHFEQMIDEGEHTFLFNPLCNEVSIIIIEEMIKHFERQEKYEHCEILKQILEAH
tara:strand:+ start:1507 stop:1755 length:249 start_codon:yes stop_codon:yes gene_type:complete